MSTLRETQIEAAEAESIGVEKTRIMRTEMIKERNFQVGDEIVLEMDLTLPAKGRKRRPRPNYSYRAMRRNGCIRFGHFKWADFQRVRPWTWRQVAA